MLKLKDYVTGNVSVVHSLTPEEVGEWKNTLGEFAKSWDKLIEKYPQLEYPETIDSLFKEYPAIAEMDIKELLETLEIEQFYHIYPNSPVLDIIKRISIAASNNRVMKANKNVKVKAMETLDGKYLLSYATGKENYEVSVDNALSLKRNQSIMLRKTLNFILIKANDQHYPDQIYFSLAEYMENMGETSKDAAYISAKRELDILLGFKMTGVRTRGKKEIRHAMDYVFTGRDISYNQCYVRCLPSHVEMLCQYFSLLPKWAGELSTKAYDLLDSIYYLARQNTSKINSEGHFHISLKSINDRIGGRDPKETERHKQFIIKPILDAIKEIEKIQQNNELKITPVHDTNYKNGHDFLQGYLEIEMEKTALDYYKSINKKKEDKMRKLPPKK